MVIETNIVNSFKLALQNLEERHHTMIQLNHVMHNVPSIKRKYFHPCYIQVKNYNTQFHTS